MLDMNAIRGRLRINKHALDDELEVQAELQDHICRHVAQLQAQLQEQKDALQRLEHELGEDVRLSTRARVSRDTVLAAIGNRREFQQAQDRVTTLRTQVQEAQGLLDAWTARGHALRTLAQLQMAGYYSSSSYRPPALPGRVRVHTT